MIYLSNQVMVFERIALTTLRLEMPVRVAHVCGQCGAIIHAVVEYPRSLPDGAECLAKSGLRTGGKWRPSSELVLNVNAFGEAPTAYGVIPEYSYGLFADPANAGQPLLQFYDTLHFLSTKKEGRSYGACRYQQALIGGPDSSIPAWKLIAMFFDKYADMDMVRIQLTPVTSMIARATMFPEIGASLLTKMFEDILVVEEQIGKAYPIYLFQTSISIYDLVPRLENLLRADFPHIYADDAALKLLEED